MRHKPRGPLALLLGVLMTLGLLGLQVPMASAHPNLPFQAVDDSYTLFEGEYMLLDVEVNDTLTEGVDDDVCSVRGLDPNFAYTDLVNGDLFLQVYWGDAPPGDVVTFDYAICDDVHLSWATVTVTVKQLADIKVRKLRRDGKVVEGKLVAINRNDARAHVLYGTYSELEPDGTVHVRANDRKVFEVSRKKIDWEAYLGPRWVFVNAGQVRNIPLRRDADRASAAARTALTVPWPVLNEWGPQANSPQRVTR